MYWFEADKRRFVLEYIKVNNKYPDFILNIEDDEVIYKGEVNLLPQGVTAPPLEIQIICKDSYPVTEPKIYPLCPNIPKECYGHNWHRWKDGKICFIHPKMWTINYFLVEAIEKVEIWYFNFLAYVNNLIEDMPDEGLANVPVKGGC